MTPIGGAPDPMHAQVVSSRDKQTFIIELYEALRKNPRAEVHYSTSANSLGVIHSALILNRPR